MLFRGDAEPVQDFLQAALDTTTCTGFVKESRMNFATSNQLHRKFRGA
jgi:hypothetical protein